MGFCVTDPSNPHLIICTAEGWIYNLGNPYMMFSISPLSRPQKLWLLRAQQTGFHTRKGGIVSPRSAAWWPFSLFPSLGWRHVSLAPFYICASHVSTLGKARPWKGSDIYVCGGEGEREQHLLMLCMTLAAADGGETKIPLSHRGHQCCDDFSKDLILFASVSNDWRSTFWIIIGFSGHYTHNILLGPAWNVKKAC